MSVKLLAEHHLEFLSLKEAATGQSESTLLEITCHGAFVSDARSYRNKLTLYLSHIKLHWIIISEVSQKSHKKRLSVQVVRLSVKVCCTYLYTIKLLSFSYISAKFEVAVSIL